MRRCWLAATSPVRPAGGPVEDGLDGAVLEADAGVVEGVTQGCHSGGEQVLGCGEVPEQVPGDGAVPELVEAGGEAGQGGLEVVADLAVEGGALADEVAAVADEELQGRSRPHRGWLRAGRSR